MSDNFQFTIFNLQSGIPGVNILEIVKWFVVALVAMYAVFALVMIKQVGIMTESVETDSGGKIKFLAGLHFLAAAVLVVFSIVVLP